jgi:hypothetical protein
MGTTKTVTATATHTKFEMTWSDYDYVGCESLCGLSYAAIGAAVMGSINCGDDNMLGMFVEPTVLAMRDADYKAAWSDDNKLSWENFVAAMDDIAAQF